VKTGFFLAAATKQTSLPATWRLLPSRESAGALFMRLVSNSPLLAAGRKTRFRCAPLLRWYSPCENVCARTEEMGGDRAPCAVRATCGWHFFTLSFSRKARGDNAVASAFALRSQTVNFCAIDVAA